jgi:transposase
MPRIAEQMLPVIGGVDTHADVHVAAVVDQVGRVLGTQAFPATAAGYRAALAWMRAHGELVKVGVEGTGSYGAGLARYLAACGIEVAEVMRPNRQARRQRGKSDAAGAVAAALAALSGEASGVPKSRDGAVEAGPGAAGGPGRRGQGPHPGRQPAARPGPHRTRQVHLPLAGLPGQRQVDLAARFRPHDLAGPAEGAKAAMASVARRHQELAAEIARLDAALEELLTRAAPPEFLAKQGVATVVAATLLTTAGDNPGRVRKEASFAALCGASPVDASSGKQLRHRLNRGGDRQANSALWTIAMTRLAHDPRTKAYAARRTTEGKTRKEIIRCLRRYIAREIYKTLCQPKPPATTSAPQAKQDLSAPALT